MAGLLPSAPDLEDRESEPRVLGVDDEDADDVLGALSSETAREILAALHDDPATPSAVANEVDTSLQNAQYHLSNLEDAELVTDVGTQYSEKGREMTVYGPADAPLVLFAGGGGESVESALVQMLTAVGVLGAASLAVQWALTRGGGPSGGPGGGQVGIQSVEQPASAALPPGAVFFLGGVLVLTVVVSWYVYRQRR